MNTIKNKYKNIYIFISIISLIGLISGYNYYKFQPQETKETIIKQIDIKESLKYKTTTLKRNILPSITILISSILIIPQLYNIFNIFYKSFQIGFIFNVLHTFSMKLSLIYTLIYQLLPLLIYIILFRISISISINIIRLITKNKHKLKLFIYKYLIIETIFILINIIFLLYSGIINNYLLTLLK